MAVKYHLIPFGSLFYLQLLALRQDILRTPLGLTLEFEQTRTDHLDWHIGVIYMGQLVGGVSLTPRSSEHLKMRLMGIDTSYQRLGFGKRLVYEAEKFAKVQGYHKITLDARHRALSFYEKSGYQIASDSFQKCGISHREMQKTLVPNSFSG